MEIKKNIVLVDDHVIVRNGLRELIEKIGPYKISHEFDSGESFLEAIPLKPEPDLIMLDLSFPGMKGDDIVEKLKYLNIETPILILTLNSDENIAVKLFRLGVRGYLAKNCSAATLRSALEEIFQSGYYHNEFLAKSLKQNVSETLETEREKIIKNLTPREREFLKLVCHEAELTYDQIADQMGIQHRTVDGYRESIFHKFEIKSKTGLVLFVLKYRLIDLL